MMRYEVRMGTEGPGESPWETELLGRADTFAEAESIGESAEAFAFVVCDNVSGLFYDDCCWLKWVDETGAEPCAEPAGLD